MSPILHSILQKMLICLALASAVGTAGCGTSEQNADVVATALPNLGATVDAPSNMTYDADKKWLARGGLTIKFRALKADKLADSIEALIAREKAAIEGSLGNKPFQLKQQVMGPHGAFVIVHQAFGQTLVDAEAKLADGSGILCSATVGDEGELELARSICASIRSTP